MTDGDKLVALGIATNRRSSPLPGLPTIDEAGVKAMTSAPGTA